MPMEEIELECEEKMERAACFLRDELRTVRSGRASTALVEHLKVDVPSYGSAMELRELASLSAPEPNLIVIKPFDPSIIRDIDRAIKNSDLGITPSSDRRVVRLPIPPLSGERRQQIVQQVKRLGEAQKVTVRNARRDANKQINSEEKKGVLNEDDAERCRANVQELTDKYEEQIDQVLEAKIKEIEQV